ncbi:MAG: hypothetical protein Fur005_06120 [Roseiflexaceae bacterium]
MLAPANGWVQTIGMLMFPISLAAGLTAWNIGGLIALILGGIARLLGAKPKPADPAHDPNLPPARWILFPVIACCGLIAGLLISLFGAANLGSSLSVCLAAHLAYATLVYLTAPTFSDVETV